MRRPISRVRSVTDTYMMFIMPMPPTTSEMPAMQASLFAGDVDFPAVAKAIAGIGYDDYITLEMLPNYKQFPEVSLYADKYAMNKIIEMIHL